MAPAVTCTRAQPAATFAVCRAILKTRQEAHARAHRRLVQLVQQRQQLVGDLALASANCPLERRTVTRAIGAWRGSTAAGYLREGDDQTYLQNFRCTKARFDALVANLKGSRLDGEEKRTVTTDWRKARRIAQARGVLDPPDRRFKVAACLYAIGQGGPLKVLADVCSIGKSTLRKYLCQFAHSIIAELKPKYMPCKPWSDEERKAVQDKFASRRGLRPVTMACDGTHIPFKPLGKKLYLEYRNFKGWTSILAVAFVDSSYRFFDMDVGYPGRAGDNTVLAHNWFMRNVHADPDTWLGTGGVILVVIVAWRKRW